MSNTDKIESLREFARDSCGALRDPAFREAVSASEFEAVKGLVRRAGREIEELQKEGATK